MKKILPCFISALAVATHSCGKPNLSDSHVMGGWRSPSNPAAPSHASELYRYEVQDSEMRLRQDALVTYVSDHESEVKSFMDYSNGIAGTPLILFRVFPYLFPEIWGEPGSGRDSFDFASLGPVNPRMPDSPFPFGFGWSREDPVDDYPELTSGTPAPRTAPLEAFRQVNITCGGCHSQFIRSKKDAEPKLIIGGTNPQKNFFLFLAKLGMTAKHPNYTPEKVLAVVKEKYEAHGADWFFSRGTNPPADAAKLRAVVERDYKKLMTEGDIAVKRVGGQLVEKGTIAGLLALSTFGSEDGKGAPGQASKAPISQLNGSFSAYGVARLLGFVSALKGQLLKEYVAANPDIAAGSPAFNAGLGAFMQQEIPKRMVTFSPARTDIPPVWGQGKKQATQWDGTITQPLLRNLAASFASVLDARVLDVPQSIDAAKLLKELPAPPYPFAIDRSRSERGRGLYKAYCSSCHSNSAFESAAQANNEIYPAVANKSRVGNPATGTEPYRAYIFNDAFATRLNQTLLAGCPATKPGCDTFDRTASVLAKPRPLAERGYVASPLDGIWATSPYLHNGSVPTLHHLLVPEKRAEATTFVRGLSEYDEDNLGFQWNGKADGMLVQTYDTTLFGQSNSGHDTAEYLGLDWSKEPEKLADLLEFMKTL